jgi:outer membrane protein assembly factor BamB
MAGTLLIGHRSVNAQQLTGQPVENPIYIADSPTASDALARLPELLAQHNLDEAARLSDEIITSFGDRLIESKDPGISVHVRSRLQSFILEHPDLLAVYRRRVTPRAAAWLVAGDWQRVMRDCWLTEPGFFASLSQAQTLIESAHFNAGLRALIELEHHPDADADAHARRASALAALVASYLDTDQAWTLAYRWSARAGESPIDRIKQHTSINTNTLRPTGSLIWDIDDPIDSVELDGIVSRPLQSVELSPKSNLDPVQTQNQSRLSGASWNPSTWISPVAVGSMLYTNDGITLSCFDRFTLRPIWRLQTAEDSTDLPLTPDARARLGRVIEDITGITVVGDDLYVPAGIPRNGIRTGNADLLKVDAKTGRIKWAVDISTLDESLDDASIRGQVLFNEGIVIVGARTNNRRQRLISLSIVGLDSATGELLWIRQIGSAGSLPFQQVGQLAHSPILHDGVVYWTDHIGLAFAIETATGRVLWARPMPTPDLYARLSRPPFATNTPALTKDGLFLLTTDGTEIFQLDPETGKTLAQKPAEPIAESFYLLAINDTIACVSNAQITYFSSSRFATAATTRSPTLGGADAIRGRVVLAGDSLLAPVETGVEILDPLEPALSTHIDLDRAGNILALDGQLLVIDEMDVSSFLSWETASILLEDRIAQDPSAAITLAELAFRAGKGDQTVPAIGRAMGVIAGLSLDDRQRLGDQLFAVILDMLRQSINPPVGSTPPGDAQNSSPKVLGANDQSTLLNQLDKLAHTHDQVVAQRMALGAFNERRSNPSQAIGAYQYILDQPALSASMWRGSGIAVRGGLEASKRIRAILDTNGYTPYRKFSQLAQTERAFLAQTRLDESVTVANAEMLEELARRYPWASITPAIWLDVAVRWQDQHQRGAAINAAVEGIDAAETLNGLGVGIDQETINTLAEVAITEMIATNRTQDAQLLAASLTQRFKDLTLRLDGQLITRDQIAQRARTSSKLPVLGDSFLDNTDPILLTGSPIKPGNRLDQGGVVLYAPQLGRIEYVRAGRGAFESIWSRSAKISEPPVIPWQDQSRTVVLWAQNPSSTNPSKLEAIETTTGRVIWSIDDVDTALTKSSTRLADAIARNDGLFTNPLLGPTPNKQLVVVTDGHTLVITDRIGRAMGIDLFTGKVLWNADLPANRIHDLNLAGGVLGICGLMVVDPGAQQRDGSTTSIVASIDPRTGQTIQIIDRFGLMPRWIRVGHDGDLFVATAQRIVGINTKEGSINWIVNDEGLIDSLSGWIFGDQLLVLDMSANLWAISLAEGTRSPMPLEMRKRLNARRWVRIDNTLDTLRIASSNGLSVFNRNQQLIASDPIDPVAPLVDVARGLDRVIFVQSPITKGDRSITKLYLLDQRDARLLDETQLAVPITLDRVPTSITAITGGVIVGYNEVAVFVRTEMVIQ